MELYGIVLLNGHGILRAHYAGIVKIFEIPSNSAIFS